MRSKLALAVAASAVAAAFLTPPAGAEGDVREGPFEITETHIRAGTAEPSIALSSRDHVFMCGPNGFPGGRNTFVRSEDWVTFEQKDIFDRTGGGDCDVEVGPDDAIYTANLQLWASAIRKSTDDGKTFSSTATEDAVEQDRQWLATDPTDPAIVYMGYHDWSISAIVIAKSIDGGQTFLIHSLVSSDPLIHADSARKTIPGPVVVDPTDPERVYMVWATGTTEGCLADAGACPTLRTQQIVMGRSEDGGLTWTNTVAMRGGPTDVLGFIPWMAVDLAGNVYAAATGRLGGTNGIFLASSTDRGDTWAGPVKANAGENAATFPTVVGGSGGVVDLAWIESDTTTDPDDVAGVWRVRFAQSRNATDAAPTFTEVAGPVIHRGAVCLRGLLCITGGDRSLLDFMDMDLDAFGYAHMAVASNLWIDGTKTGTHILYWRQDAGPSATSEPCVPACVGVRPGPRPLEG